MAKVRFGLHQSNEINKDASRNLPISIIGSHSTLVSLNLMLMESDGICRNPITEETL